MATSDLSSTIIRNSTFDLPSAIMRLEGLNKTLNTIQAIAIAGGSMFSGDDKHKTSCVLFDHIQDLTADASDYYALHDMLAELELTRGVCHE